MSFADLSSIAGAVLLSLGGGAAIVFALAKWLGGVWASRILESEKAKQAREQELLVRRRNIYSKLSVSLRVFLSASTQADSEAKNQFLAAYDEAALWAPDEVMNSVGDLLAQIKNKVENQDSISEAQLQSSYEACITSMRKDCGFPNTTFKYRVVSF